MHSPDLREWSKKKHHTLYELFLEPFPKMNRPLKGILKQRTKEADKNFDNIYC